MRLPLPRGPISSELFRLLAGDPVARPTGIDAAVADDGTPAFLSDDLQITLFACYALHYDGFHGVSDRWEWWPSLLELRSALEHRFERDLTGLVGRGPVEPIEVPGRLLALASPARGMDLADFVRREATVDQFRELMIHRSVYNLREADQHTWAIPRVTGRAKSALLEIQADEYGGGMPGRMHAELFAITMAELDLDQEYGAHIERIPAISLALLNIVSFFGLHRRMRGALLGNLAVTEIGSSVSNRRYGEGLARLGGSERARWFFDEHVRADAVHEQLAAHDMCGVFVREHPDEAASVVFGAESTLALRGRFAREVLGSWERGSTLLRGGAR